MPPISGANDVSPRDWQRLEATPHYADIAAAQSEAEHLGAPLTILRPAEVDMNKLYKSKLALARPEHHVAWRGDGWTGFPNRALRWPE